MNLKMNALSIAVASLLFAGQSAVADVTTTATLNGVTRDLTFATQADLEQFFNNPTNAQKAVQQDLFRDPATGLAPFDTNGLITQTEVNGVPVTLTKVTGVQYAILQPNADGTLEAITIQKPVGVNNPVTGQPATVFDVIAAYSKAISDPAAPLDPAYANSVKAGATADALTTINANIASLATASVAAPSTFPAGAATHTDDTSPEATVKGLLAKQVAIASLATANTIAPVAAPAPTPVTPGSIVDLSNDPDVKLAAANAQVAAAAAVEALPQVTADPALVSFAKAEASSASSFKVDATIAITNQIVATGTDAQKQQALADLKTALAAQTAALNAVATDPNASPETQAAALAAAKAAAATAAAAASSVVAAITDPTLKAQAQADAAAVDSSVQTTQNTPDPVATANIATATQKYTDDNTAFTGAASSRDAAKASATALTTSEGAKITASTSTVNAITADVTGAGFNLTKALADLRSLDGLASVDSTGIAASVTALQGIKTDIDAKLADLDAAAAAANAVVNNTAANQAQKDSANAVLANIATLKTSIIAEQTAVQNQLAALTQVQTNAGTLASSTDTASNGVGNFITTTVTGTEGQTAVQALADSDKLYLLQRVDQSIQGNIADLQTATSTNAASILADLTDKLKVQDIAAKAYAKVANADQTVLSAALAQSNAIKAALTTALTSTAFADVLTNVNAAIALANTSIADISALTDPALADLGSALAKLSSANSTKSELEGSDAFVKAKKELATPGSLKAAEIISLREGNGILNSGIAGQVHDAEALLAKALKEGGQSDAAKAQIAQIKQGIAALKASDAVQLYDKTASAEYYVENTADNGIAGNPSSTMNLMVDGMFSQIANVGNGSTANIAASSDNGIKHSFDVGLNYNYFNLHGTSVNNVNLTPSFSTKFDSKGQLILSLPLSYISGQVSNLDSYQVGTGIAYKYDVTDNWSITPAFNYAYRMVSNNSLPTALDKYNALTLGDGTSMYGGSLTNKFNFKWSGINVGITNMNGYFENIGGADNNALGYTGVSGYGNDISNYVLKNGISLGKKVAGYDASTYLTDTEYFSVGGSKNVFFDQISEFGFAVKPDSFGSNLNVSAGYMFSYKSGPKGDLDGFKLNVNYKFD